MMLKHKQVLYRFARKFLVTRNIKKIENKRNALGTILLEISKRLGKGMLSEKLGIGMMNQIKESLIEQKIEVEDHGVKHKHSEMRNVIRLEKLDQQLTDAKAILRLSTLEKYDENDAGKKIRLLNSFAGRVVGRHKPQLKEGRIGWALQQELGLYPTAEANKRQKQLDAIRKQILPDDLEEALKALEQGKYG